MLAMLLIGGEASYLFCDVDPDSVASLEDGARQVGLIGQTRVVNGDGRAAIWEEALKLPDLRSWTVHVDPFDAFSQGPSGTPSAAELARRLAERGAVIRIGTATRIPLARRGPGAKSRRPSGVRLSLCGVKTCASPSRRRIQASSGAASSSPTPVRNRCVDASSSERGWRTSIAKPVYRRAGADRSAFDSSRKGIRPTYLSLTRGLAGEAENDSESTINVAEFVARQQAVRLAQAAGVHGAKLLN